MQLSAVASFVRQDSSKCMRVAAAATPRQLSARASTYGAGHTCTLLRRLTARERGDIKSIGMETEKLRKNHLGSSF
jgi:hypothetical protein